MQSDNLTGEVLNKAKALGARIVGVASVVGLKEKCHPEHNPADILADARSMVVFGLEINQGFLKCRIERLKNFTVTQICRQIDDISFRLARFLAERGCSVAIIPASVPTPLKGYHGFVSLRHAAVEAGLGEIGTSQCFLSYDVGPRVYLGGVLTSAELISATPQKRNLCEEVGCRKACARACPAGAIMPDGTFDKRRCQQFAQPAGLRVFLKRVQSIVNAVSQQERDELIFSNSTYEIWESFLSHVGAYGGCFRCMEVCPVGR